MANYYSLGPLHLNQLSEPMTEELEESPAGFEGIEKSSKHQEVQGWQLGINNPQ